MKSDMIKCPYCPDKFHRAYLNDHMEYEHRKQLRQSLKRAKAGIIIAASFVVIAIGIVVGLLL